MLLCMSIGMFFCILFYIITYPYTFKLKRKLKKITSYPEVTVIENPNYSEEIPKSEIAESIHIEKRTGQLEYYVIQHKDFNSKAYPSILLFHGLRDKAYDWIEKARILETYLSLRKQGKISPMNFILVDSGDGGESWYLPYENYFMQKLLPKLREEFPNISVISGFSMGAYAACYFALQYPIFQVVGSFSGAISLIRMGVNRRIIYLFRYLYIPKFLFPQKDKQHFFEIFSSWGYKILEKDPYTLLKQIKNKKKTHFYFSVGREDYKNYLMLQQWNDIVLRAKKHQISFQAQLCLKEGHTWDYVARDFANFLCYVDQHTTAQE